MLQDLIDETRLAALELNEIIGTEPTIDAEALLDLLRAHDTLERAESILAGAL